MNTVPGWVWWLAAGAAGLWLWRTHAAATASPTTNLSTDNPATFGAVPAVTDAQSWGTPQLGQGLIANPEAAGSIQADSTPYVAAGWLGATAGTHATGYARRPVAA